MALIVHAADVHLDSPLTGLVAYEGAPAADVALATRRALSGVVDLALDEQAELVVFAGDLYDGDLRDISTGLFLCGQLARLRREGVEVVIAHGNHDAQSVVTRRLPLPHGVRTLPSRRPISEPFERFGVVVHGQSYPRREVTEDLSGRYPDPIDGLLNVGVLHTGLTGRDGHDRYAPCSAEALAARGYHYWALGHVHRHEIAHRDPWVVFPGCVQGRTPRESGPKGVVLVRADGDRITSVDFRAVDVVRWVDLEVDVTRAEDRDAVLDCVRCALADAVVDADGRTVACRVTLRGACNAHRALGAHPDRLTDEVRAVGIDVGAGAVWIERVICRTEPDRAFGDLVGRRDPMARLLEDVRAQADDLAGVRSRVPELDELVRLLPPGTLDLDHPGPDDAAWMAERTAGAERLLLGRLSARGPAS